MKISKRLKFIVDQIKFKSIVDVGTDHAYVPICAILNKKIKKAIATDINKNVLKIAEKNIHASKLEYFIDLRLSDGLKNVAPKEAETLIISGMGGLLIKKIICDSLNVFLSFDQIILQPQKNSYEVRKLLHANNFKITNEIFLCDRKKYYNIICADKGDDIFYREIDYVFGKILLDQNNLLLKEFLLNHLNKILKLKNYNARSKKNICEALECFVQK
jgi:tRNA (adenine22-N1)-methyltransferase